MKLLLLLLAPSVVFAQRYHPSTASSSTNPNDQPFLPIYPIYPYSPKLIKRGTEHDILTHLTPELYAPKIDARDTYTSSFAPNYQRDPYYPTYNPYPKQTVTSSSGVSGNFPAASLSNAAYSSAASYPTGTFTVPTTYSSPNLAYSSPNAAYANPNSHYPTAGYSNPYSYSPTPYYNSYSTPYTSPPNPYSSAPYTPANYPNYNYQAPYYYPNYYNQPYPPLPPPPPSAVQDYSSSSSDEDTSEENEPSSPKPSTSSKKSSNKKNRQKNNEPDNSVESKDEQFVDGGNYLSSSNKDLDGQSSTYKTSSPYNQLEQYSDVHLRSVSAPGVPRTTYRVISVGGQPVGPDYPLPQSYAKVQQLEHIMSQTLAKLLAQNAGNQGIQPQQYQYQNQQQNDNSNSGFVTTTNNKPPVIAKTGLGYVMNPTNLAKLRNDQYIGNYGNGQNPLLIKVQDPNQAIQSGSTILSKAAGKYADGHYGQKTVTTVSLQQAPGIYIPPEAKNIDKDETSQQQQTSDFNDYDSSGGQTYDNPGSYKKNEENYSIDQGQGPVAYHSSNLVTVQPPLAQNYQYSSYLPTQSTQQQSRDYKTSLDDVNFGTKRNTKI